VEKNSKFDQNRLLWTVPAGRHAWRPPVREHFHHTNISNELSSSGSDTIRKLEGSGKQVIYAQWEVFIQKGGQNYFLFRFLLFGVKIMFSMILWDTRSFFDKIRPGRFIGQNSGYIACITSREKIYISKMVFDSDLQSLSAVVMIFGDILTMYPTLLL
jgi:hypothetical protein